MPAIGPLLEPAPIVLDKDEEPVDEVAENEPPVEAVGPLVEAALAERPVADPTVAPVEPPSAPEPIDLLDTSHAPWLADPELGVAWRESWVASQAEAGAPSAEPAAEPPVPEPAAPPPPAPAGRADAVVLPPAPAPAPAPDPGMPPLPPRRYEPRSLDRFFAAEHGAAEVALPPARRWAAAAPAPAPVAEPVPVAAAVEEAPASQGSSASWWRAALAGVLLGVLAGVGAYAMGPGRDEVRLARFRVPVPQLPPALEGVRIAHVSDLMLPRGAAAVAGAAAIVAREQPDIVVLSGDLLDGSDAGALGRFTAPLAQLKGRLATVAVIGEHDLASGATRAQLAAAFARQGITLLDGAPLAVPVKGATLQLVGATGEDAAAVTALARQVPAGARAVWVTHQPGWLAGAAAAPLHDAALVLAGHTRGGQVRLPFTGGFRPDGSGPYVHGWYRVGSALLHVSTGIGTAGIPARLLSPPGVALLTLAREHVAGELPVPAGR